MHCSPYDMMKARVLAAVRMPGSQRKDRAGRLAKDSAVPPSADISGGCVFFAADEGDRSEWS